jgi:hypothetical protein
VEPETPARPAHARGPAALRGEIPPAADRDAVAAALLGPPFYRRWFAREQIDAESVDTIIGGAAAGLRQEPRHPKPDRAVT